MLLRKEVKIERSRDRRIAGICGGIGEQLGMDPNIVRLLWVLGTLLSLGAGVLAYLLLWALLPKVEHKGEAGWDGEPDMPRGWCS
ncbi:MAG TPA: PspC domain-containing protein [Candidatus Latescibacteria bacterium]|nr:PspC domain-containing protein [Candidatus Latescibacterota bacterium]